ncbi:MAG: response regulator [gamma proteobacterium symbiont of Phacoides pectinatus]
MRREMVLVVEDDAALREALSDTLELAGYGVITAADGESALEAMRQTQVGMVVSDVQMTPMNGQELLGRIKRGFPSVPVLLMTAYGNIEKAVTAMRDGAVDYLAKPFEPELLLAKVKQSIRPPDPGDGRLVVEDLRTRV